jgi:hypothetical protein
MGGIYQSNVPAFDYMAHKLRADGYEVISPAELDSPEERAELIASKDGSAAARTWGASLGRDVTIVADQVQAIVVLPGWRKSRGARLEVFVALLCNKPVYEDDYHGTAWYDDYPGPHTKLVPINRVDLVFAIARSFL